VGETFKPRIAAAVCLTAAVFAPASCRLRAATQPALPTAPLAAAPAEDGQWAMPAKNDANTRYSALAEINTSNVRDLTLAFTFSTGVTRGQESAPIVVGSMMYVLSPYPHFLYALDLSKPGAPMKWSYDPKAERAAQGVACCDTVNRGPTYADGHVFFNTLDGNTVSVDADTGKQAWKTKSGDFNTGETMTMAPLVARGKVFIGNSGGEYGVRGWIIALDETTGKPVWKAYNTGPDADCLIGPDFKPFYPGDRGRDLGVSTWPPQAWQQGGGNVWGFLSYDPELNLLYHGTGNPGPWNAEQRPGDNKWTNGIFARDPDTGKARWYYQFTPHDLFDWDGINENILLDMPWRGEIRKVLVHPDRNGYLYVLDRRTGEVLEASQYGTVNTTSGVDLTSGRLVFRPDRAPQLDKVVRNLCPTAPGAKDWNPSAFSPRTGFLYIPHNNLCVDWQSETTGYIAGTPYIGAELRMIAGPGGNRGVMTAWDVVAGKPAWQIKEDFPLWSGAVATAGDIVFYGTLEGWFKAVDAHTGKLLWRFKTGSGIIGQPTTYRGPDGHQYVAVLSGIGGWVGSLVSNDLDPRDGTAAKGMANAVRDLKTVTTKGGTLYVFSLPESQAP
jgi:PQQ-dependent dehydrogenase (methanol/ethanol family)